MTEAIVHRSAPVALFGGAQLGTEVLNILQTVAATYVAADGGVAHLRTMGVMPAAVIGDLDSITDTDRAAFDDVLHEITDQNTTDFEKAVSAIDAPVIIAAGFLGGRLDHTFAAMNYIKRKALRHIILVSDDDACFLASKTCTTLSLPIGTRVGLLPGSARVDTQGLRWEIKDAAMSEEGFISTSNETAAEDVHIYAVGLLMITLPLSALPAAIAAVRAE